MTTSEKLLDAAELRMRRTGYNTVSFRDLAADINIKSASAHYHFPRKEDLGLDLVKRYHARFFTTLDAAAAGENTRRGKIECFRLAYRSALVDDRLMCLCGLLGSEIASLPDAVATEVKGFFKASIGWVASILADGTPQMRHNNEAAGFVATMQGALMLAICMEDAALFDAMTERALDLIAGD